MEWLVTAKEMKTCDHNTSQEYEISSLVLMERAALAVVDVIEEKKLNTKKVLVLCGTGNNGADGLAVARLLFLKGIDVAIYIVGDRKKVSKEFGQQYAICKHYDIQVVESVTTGAYSLIVDGIFGIGLSRDLSEEYTELIHTVNQLLTVKVAIDIPSGISADSGALMPTAVRADYTVTFSYKKLGEILYPGTEYCGELILKDVGINDYSWMDKKPAVCALNQADLQAHLHRPAYSNKGTFGKVLVIGGSVNMAGAVYFSAKAAYCSGCGLVRIYTSEENRVILQSRLPEAILTTYTGKRPDLNALNEALSWADVIVIGPGLGTDDTAKSILRNTLKNTAVPIIVDADALNIISEDTSVLLHPHTDMIITPHLGEMARLSKDSISYIQENILLTAQEFAREYNVICVLKDARTVTSIPYGKTYVNTTGNDGMATGGSGDVLSGIIGGLVAQGIHPEVSAPLAVYMHGMAADYMARQRGRHGLLADDIIEGLRNNIFIQ